MNTVHSADVGMRANSLKILLIGLALCLFSLGFAETMEKQLWVQWQQNNPLSEKRIDHHPWQHFLDTYLTKPKNGLNHVDYASVTKDDKKHLKDYLTYLSHIKISEYNRNEQLAYWLNLYNALAINLILQNYPVDSIQDINISPGLFTVGPWEANQITIENMPISLYDIRHRIVRAIWNDVRTLYAMHNTSIGAANLFHEAFDATKLDTQLNQAVSDYVNCPRGVNLVNGGLIVSRMYQWYEEDFGGNPKYVLKHLMQYAKPKLKKQLSKKNTITDYMYNWHLNQA